jgi:hypothetical protein
MRLPTFRFLVKLKNRPPHEAHVQCNDPQTAAQTAILSAQYRLGQENQLETIQYLGVK